MSKSIKHRSITIACVVLAAAGLALWYVARSRHDVHAATNTSPFTIQQHDEITGPHVGIAAIIETRTIAIRGDGSRVDVKREARRGLSYRVIKFSNGVVQNVFDSSRVVSTTQRTSAEQEGFRRAKSDPASNCIADLSGSPSVRPPTLEGTETRLNTPVFRINSNGITTWKAASLGCTELEHFIDWDTAHPGTNTTTLKVDSISLGEPDPGLFTVPAEYQEMTLTKATVAHLRTGSTPEDFIQKYASSEPSKSQDTYYNSHRPK